MKVFLSFFMGFAVLFASIAASVQEVTAISPHIVITHVQAGGSGAATQEVVVLYNNGDADIGVTNWCLTNKNGAKIFCFNDRPGSKTVIPGRSYATIVSVPYALTHAGEFPSQFTTISQSSGSITGGGDTVSLIDDSLSEVDKISWSSSLAGGSFYMRKMTEALDALSYVDTDTQGDWSVVVNGVIPKDESHIEMFDLNVCMNMEGMQPVVPDGMVLDSAGACVEKRVYEPLLTEVLPNAIGADTGNEFIEIYNPNDIAIALSDYVFRIGPQLSDTYVFPAGVTIEPHAYVSFSNAEIKFNLLNTSSRVSLTLTDGTVVNEIPAYEDPEEGFSWALVDETWQYTTTPTPGKANIMTLSVTVSAVLQPCAANQYRSTETNRCRLLATAIIPTPCKVGQYRNEETGRCRAIASDAKTTAPCGPGQIRNAETNRCRKVATATAPTPCKAGQERNAETNRCRNVTKMTNAGYGVLGAEKKNDANWYVLATVAGILLLALTYAGMGVARGGCARYAKYAFASATVCTTVEVIYTERMRIIGIDPGTGILGFGVIDVTRNTFKMVTAGVIRTAPHTPHDERLEEIFDGLTDIIAETKPQQFSIEKLFFTNNVTTAMTVAEARGVAMLVARKAKLPIAEYTPPQIKQSLTGYGKADKKQVQEMVRMQLGLKEVPKPDDCADALAAAITHSLMSRLED